MAKMSTDDLIEAFKELSLIELSEFVKALFEHVLSREPAPKEQVECTRFLAEFKGSAEARRQLALVLLNHNDFVTIR